MVGGCLPPARLMCALLRTVSASSPPLQAGRDTALTHVSGTHAVQWPMWMDLP